MTWVRLVFYEMVLSLDRVVVGCLVQSSVQCLRASAVEFHIWTLVDGLESYAVTGSRFCGRISVLCLITDMWADEVVVRKNRMSTFT